MCLVSLFFFFQIVTVTPSLKKCSIAVILMTIRVASSGGFKGWPGVAWPPHLSSTTGMNCTDLYRPSEIISPTSLFCPSVQFTLRYQATPPDRVIHALLKQLVILKPKNDEDIEADNFVLRDYVCS